MVNTIELTAGVIAALTFAANNKKQFKAALQLNDGDFLPKYDEVISAFQDIPYRLVDPRHWWFGHYWASGRMCKKCSEISQMFPCDEPVTDQQFQAMTQNIWIGHDPACSAHNVCDFLGLKSSIGLYVE